MSPLGPYVANVTSQSGEDGVLAEIFRRIGVVHRYCVEFGAWDGKYLSNTWSLWHDQGWRALLIEGDRERLDALASSVASLPQVRPVCAYVQPEGESSLDNLLARHGAPRDLDLLSIDVDGDDHHIWRGMTRFKPRVVVIEYNPTIPAHLELVQKRGEYFGASAAALVRLGEEKGYRLAFCTKTNCIFVDAACWHRLDIGEPGLQALFPVGHLTHVITAYDGRTFIDRTPTYAGALPSLGPNVALRELLCALRSRAGARLVPTEGALEPVTLFTPDGESHRSILWRALRYAWRQFARTPIGRPAQRWREQRTRLLATRTAITQWERAGRPVPPPHAYKQVVVRDYARRYGLPILIETGTYLGDMVEASRGSFQHVYSIELDEDLHSRAVLRFAAHRKVHILKGDSGIVLPQVLGHVNDCALFWLDGHYSADITARGDKDTPILSELDSIRRHAQRERHVVLIDDARCFDGTRDYPTLDALRGLAALYWPDHTFEVKDDIIRIAPSR